jgi:hypothetical protein
LFAIDRALQIYWQSCSENEDRRAINTRILQMQDLQNNIEHHNFSYILPKVLLNKFLTQKSDFSNGNEMEESQGKNETKKMQKRTIRRNKRSKTTINSGTSNQTRTSQSSSGKTLIIVQKQRTAISSA